MRDNNLDEKASQKKGFTLVELLVVISIIALLVAILLPALNKARIKAKVVQCLAHLHATGNLFMAYAADNEGHFPDHNNQWPDYVKDLQGGTDMRLLMRNYEEIDPEFYYCPLNFPYEMSPDWITVPGTPGSGWGGWNTDESHINISYYWFVNYSIPGVDDADFDRGDNFYHGFKIPRRMSDAKADIALACDPLNVHAAVGPPVDPVLDDFEFSETYNLPGEYVGSWYVHGVWQGHPWNAGGTNVLLGDGHAEFREWNSSDVKVRAYISGGWFHY